MPEELPYKEDFFSNFETYHVCDDYAEDIISYLKERDVSLELIFITVIFTHKFIRSL